MCEVGAEKSFREFVSYMNELDEIDLYVQGLELVVDELSECLVEGRGSGAIINTLASKMVTSIRKVGNQVKNSKEVGDKVDLISVQLNMIVGVVLLGIASQSSSKGIVGRGSKLLAYVRALGSK